jgi:hypothetical protein
MAVGLPGFGCFNTNNNSHANFFGHGGCNSFGTVDDITITTFSL